VTTENWQQVKRIVGECLERPASERKAYIAEACGGNLEIAEEVASLIASSFEAGDFLETSVVEQAESEDLLPGQQLGSYQLVELIGHGGMGSVYRAARTSDFRKEVAVKVVKRGMDTEFILERFRQERQILAALDHPNIARLLDGGATSDGRPYIVMELVTGQPITEYSTAHRLTVEEKLRLFQTVCSAVQHAHQNLVVHRDLKASNILVTAEGVPKLLDFGIAKLVAPDSQRTAAIFRLMTPECASPEQVRGEPLNTLSDIYSLGVLLYELLTEAKPHQFTTGDSAEIQRVICDQEPKKPSAIRPLAGDLDNIVLKAMHKDPLHRYSSAAQLSEDIGRYLSGQPVIARRDTLRYRASKFVRRHLAATVAAAAIFVSLAGGLGVSLWEAHLARMQRERADRRFADVRQLANSLLFDLHDAIKDLPGATPARKVIVDRALKYLDRLAHEEGRDPGLAEELAAAYIKVGDVQGGPNYTNLGDRTGALASYQKALQIRQALAAANPADLQARRGAARVYRRIANLQMFLGNLAEAQNSARQALGIDQAIIGDPRHSSEDEKSLARNYELIGDLLSGNGTSGSLNDDRGALENHRKALEISSAEPLDNSLLARYVRAVFQEKVADDLTRLGEREEALRLLESAQPVFEARVASGDSTARTDIALLQYRIGDTLLITGDAAAALPHYRTALELSLLQLAQDPQNAHLQLTAVQGYTVAGFALTRLGRLAEGLASMQTGERIIRSEIAKAKETGANQGALALILILSAEAYRTSGDKNQALVRGNQAADIFQSMVKAEPRDAASRLNLAACWNFLGRIWLEQGTADRARKAFQDALNLAEPSGAPGGWRSEAAKYVLADGYAGLGGVASRSGSLSEAQSWYQQSISVWERVAHPCPLRPDTFPTLGPTPVRAELDRINSTLARQGLHPR